MAANSKSIAMYARTVVKLASLVENRATLLEQPPGIEDLERIVALRARVLSRASTNMDIASLRWAARSARIEDGISVWTEMPDLPSWMHASREKIDAMGEAMTGGAVLMFDRGGEMAREDIEAAQGLFPDMGDEEVLARLTGTRMAGSPKVSQKKMREIGRRALMAIEIHLSHADPVSAILSVQDGRRLEVDGLTRIFATAIWMTGMRPIEVWQSKLMIPRFDMSYTDEMRSLALEDPGEALRLGLYTPIERARLASIESFGDTTSRAMEQTGMPAILAIQTAKTTNANIHASEAVRLQVFTKAQPGMMTMLAAATQLRHFRIDPGRRDGIRAIILRRLKRISQEEPSLADMNLNLYAFRHTFATRAKRKLGMIEAAALTGHSAIRSLYSYGRSHVSSANSSPDKRIEDDLLPSPDPVQVERLHASIEMKEPGQAVREERN